MGRTRGLMRRGWSFLTIAAILVAAAAIHSNLELRRRLRAAHRLSVSTSAPSTEILVAPRAREAGAHATRPASLPGDALRGLPIGRPGAGGVRACTCRKPESASAVDARSVPTPEGETLDSPEEADAYARRVLEQRIARAYSAEELDAAARARIVDLLARIRALRIRGLEQGRSRSAAPEESSEELRDAEIRFAELTGVGVGEFLATITATGAPEEAVRPEQAGAPEPGETRKRFADETARLLGIGETPTIEVYDGEEWKPR